RRSRARAPRPAPAGRSKKRGKSARPGRLVPLTLSEGSPVPWRGPTMYYLVVRDDGGPRALFKGKRGDIEALAEKLRRLRPQLNVRVSGRPVRPHGPGPRRVAPRG